ncbi:hypothetical protein pb186bvf_019050 [Paramecium bursaria]
MLVVIESIFIWQPKQQWNYYNLGHLYQKENLLRNNMQRMQNLDIIPEICYETKLFLQKSISLFILNYLVQTLNQHQFINIK